MKSRKHIRKGDLVQLKQDHYRTPNKTISELEYCYTLNEYPCYWPMRDKVLYAKKGDKGILINTFVAGTGCGERILYAKVKMGEEIKTFRFSSIELV